MAHAALPTINLFDSRRKGSIPYVPRQRLAPGVPRRLEAGRPGWGGVVGLLGSVGFLRVAHRLIGQRVIGQRESDCAPRALCADAASLQNSVETQGFKVRLIECDSVGIATPDQRTPDRSISPITKAPVDR
jgi:hypothetical protein